jgi:biotin operon repressor
MIRRPIREKSLCWKVLKILEDNDKAISPDEILLDKDVRNFPSISRCFNCQPHPSLNYARNLVQTAICGLRKKGFQIESVERWRQPAAYKLVGYPTDWPKEDSVFSNKEKQKTGTAI